MERSHLQFTYTNWRGDEHTYLILPMTIAYELGSFEAEGADRSWAWVLRAQVIQRDGEDRPGIRSFRLTGLNDLKEVAVAS
jgi:hypothetical protein